MATTLKGRSLVALDELTSEELTSILDLAVDRRILDQLLCDRIFVLRFFDGITAQVAAPNAKRAKSCVAVIERLVERLGRCRRESFETQSSNDEAQRRLADALDEMIDLERELARSVGHAATASNGRAG